MKFGPTFSNATLQWVTDILPGTRTVRRNWQMNRQEIEDRGAMFAGSFFENINMDTIIEIKDKVREMVKKQTFHPLFPPKTIVQISRTSVHWMVEDKIDLSSNQIKT